MIVGSTSRAGSKPGLVIEMRDIIINKASRVVLRERGSKIDTISPIISEIMNVGNIMTLHEVRIIPNICIVDQTPGTAMTPAMYTTVPRIMVCFTSLLCQIDDFSSRGPS